METKWQVVREHRNGKEYVCATYGTKKEAVKYLDSVYFNAVKKGKSASWNREGDILTIGSSTEYYCRPVE